MKSAKPYGYKPSNTIDAMMKIDADSEYEKATGGIGAEIILSIDLKNIKKLYDKNIKSGDFVERIIAVREINGSKAYANSKFIENKYLTNQENFDKWKKIFEKKLNAPNKKTLNNIKNS